MRISGSLPFYLARRLSLSSGSGRLSPAVVVSTVAVALSVAVMILALSIVVGFKREITGRVTGFNSDLTLYAHVTSADGVADPSVTLTPTLQLMLAELPYVEEASLQLNIPSILKTKDDFKGVYLKAFSGRDIGRFVEASLEEGDTSEAWRRGGVDAMYKGVSLGDSAVWISRITADKLRLKTGDVIPAYFMTDRIQVRKLKVAGIYNSHFDDYDDNFAFASLSMIQKIASLSQSQGTGISVSVDDFDNVEAYAQDLRQQLSMALGNGMIYRPLRVESARDSGAGYFHWLSMLDINVWVVLTLMTAVACITLISGMLIIMTDKVRFIALMSALGARRRQLSRVFVLLAVRVAAVGMLLGDAVALAIIMLQDKYRFLPLDPESYYIDFVPVAMPWAAFLLMNVGVILVAWLMLILPSRYVGKVSPVRVLTRE